MCANLGYVNNIIIFIIIIIKGIRPVKNMDVGLLVVMIQLKLCTIYSTSCHHRLHHHCFNKHLNKHWLTQVHLENGR